MAEQNKISIIIQAVDKATATVKAINGTIARMAAPARATGRSLDGLLKASGYTRVSKAVDGVGRSFRSVATTAAVVTGATAGVFYALTRITNAGEAATKAAQSFGTTVPQWQKLAYAAELADVSTEDLGQGLGVLNKRAIAAATGNQEAAVWFRRAGISVRDQNGHVKSSTQLFGELSDVFEKMPDGPKKLALANGLLKDSQGKLIPLLNGGSKGLREAGAEATAFGLDNEKSARLSAKFNDELKRTKGAATGVGNAIAEAILPSINALMPELTAWIASNRKLIAGIAKDLFDGLKNVGAVIWQVLKAVNAVVQVFGGWSTVVYAIAGFIGAKLVFAVLGLAKSFFVLGAAIMTTPIGWIAAGIAVIAGLAYLVIKNWEPISAFFSDLWGGIVDNFNTSVATITDIINFLIDTVLAPLRWIMEKINGLVPGVVKGASAANGGGNGSDSPVAGLAAAQQQRFGGAMTIKLEGAPARVTKVETSDGFDLDVESGYASAAGGY